MRTRRRLAVVTVAGLATLRRQARDGMRRLAVVISGRHRGQAAGDDGVEARVLCRQLARCHPPRFSFRKNY
jgi:hypothetical protein